MNYINSILQSKWLLVVFAALLVYGLFGFIPGRFDTRLLQALWNMNHVLAFYIGWLLLFQHFPGIRPSSYIIILIELVLMLLLGGVIEFIQRYTGRSVSLVDVGLNISGTLFAIISAFAIYKIRIRWRTGLSIALAILAIAVSWPNTKILIGEFIIYRHFPLIADFSYPFESQAWTAKGSRVKFRQNALEIEYLAGYSYPRVSFTSFYGDWNTYHELVIQIINPQQQSSMLHIRIHDTVHQQRGYQYNDRFAKTMTLMPGDNKIIIPVSEIMNAPAKREMHMMQLHTLMLFMDRSKTARKVLLKKIYLR